VARLFSKVHFNAPQPVQDSFNVLLNRYTAWSPITHTRNMLATFEDDRRMMGLIKAGIVRTRESEDDTDHMCVAVPNGSYVHLKNLISEITKLLLRRSRDERNAAGVVWHPYFCLLVVRYFESPQSNKARFYSVMLGGTRASRIVVADANMSELVLSGQDDAQRHSGMQGMLTREGDAMASHGHDFLTGLSDRIGVDLNERVDDVLKAPPGEKRKTLDACISEFKSKVRDLKNIGEEVLDDSITVVEGRGVEIVREPPLREQGAGGGSGQRRPASVKVGKRRPKVGVARAK